MLRKEGRQYLIRKSDVDAIFNRMNDLSVMPIMENALIKRVVCTRSDKESEKWLRILEGDIEYVGDTQRCTITYIIKDEEFKNYLLLKVDNFEDAIHFAHEMGYTEKSYQENLRSKFICKHDNADFAIRFDSWAGIENFVVMEISLISGQNALKNIIDILKIENYALVIDKKTGTIVRRWKDSMYDKASVDINDLYKLHTIDSYEASEISDITFELGLLKSREKLAINDIEVK